jgi:glycerol dehydrogenase
MRAPRKYVQGEDSLYSFAKETIDFGKKFLFICSRSAYKTCSPKIEKSFEGIDSTRRYEVFGGKATVGEIEKMRSYVRSDGIDVVVGAGGGSAIDTAKATAFYEHKPVVIIPTVVATDAPCTGLSVIYNDDHTFNQYLFYPNNPDMVIIDSDVVAHAPTKFLVSGMGDALGTFFEARACRRVDAPSLENGGITYSAMALCQLCYDNLMKYGLLAKMASDANIVTPALDAIIEANVYLSGVGADNAGLATAHSVYNGLTALSELKAQHGECVAFGSLTELIIEGADKEEVLQTMAFCHEVGLPCTLEEMGLARDPERLMVAAEKACVEGESIHNQVGDVTPPQLVAAMIAASDLGHKIYG